MHLGICELRMKYLIVFLVILASCTKKRSAEDVLSNFVKYRFKSAQNKADLLEKTTGVLHQRIADMDETSFKQFAKNKHLKMRKYRINLARCSEAACFITYTLSYDHSGKVGRKYETEVKKIAELKKEEGHWRIADVSNIKTYIDSKIPLSILD